MMEVYVPVLPALTKRKRAHTYRMKRNKQAALASTSPAPSKTSKDIHLNESSSSAVMMVKMSSSSAVMMVKMLLRRLFCDDHVLLSGCRSTERGHRRPVAGTHPLTSWGVLARTHRTPILSQLGVLTHEG